MSLEILPLAVTMMIGPQIISAVILVTSPRPVANSLAFVAGVVLAAVLGVEIAHGLAALLGEGVSLGDSDDTSSTGTILQLVLVAGLALLALKSYLGRETAEPPKWLGTLTDATPGTALRTGLLVILLMPSDIVVMLTVGVNLEQQDAGLVDALPFLGATALIAASPLLVYLLLGHRAAEAMPRLRKWLLTHSWLVSIAAYAVFIALILA